MYNILSRISDHLSKLGFFILGDSAYAIDSFIIVPCPNSKVGSKEDSFNFFHSSARITIECFFGEIALRWGIFQKPLFYSVDTSMMIIESSFRLHNFLVDYREESNSFEEIKSEMRSFEIQAIEKCQLPVFTGNDISGLGGRVSSLESVRRS